MSRMWTKLPVFFFGKNRKKQKNRTIQIRMSAVEKERGVGETLQRFSSRGRSSTTADILKRRSVAGVADTSIAVAWSKKTLQRINPNPPNPNLPARFTSPAEIEPGRPDRTPHVAISKTENPLLNPLAVC